MLTACVLIALRAGLAQAAISIGDIAESEDGFTSLIQQALRTSTDRVRPKAEWTNPLSAQEAAEFEKDMRMPIKQWLQENPGLNSDYFVKFGMLRGYGELSFWQGVHDVSDYVSSGRSGADMWKWMPGYVGEGRGPSVTLSIEGSNISISHVDSASYLADDAYCWTFGWLKGQGLDGSLMSNKPAWDALTERECGKIGRALAAEFPEENHTVYRHVMWNRVWPAGLKCNIVAGKLPFWLDLSFSMAKPASSHCTPVTKNDMREHVYRKCLFGFAATEMAYCYTRGCLMDGDVIGHGPECA